MVNKSVLSVLVSLGMLMTSLPFGGGVGGSSAGGVPAVEAGGSSLVELDESVPQSGVTIQYDFENDASAIWGMTGTLVSEGKLSVDEGENGNHYLHIHGERCSKRAAVKTFEVKEMSSAKISYDFYPGALTSDSQGGRPGVRLYDGDTEVVSVYVGEMRADANKNRDNDYYWYSVYGSEITKSGKKIDIGAWTKVEINVDFEQYTAEIIVGGESIATVNINEAVTKIDQLRLDMAGTVDAGRTYVPDLGLDNFSMEWVVSSSVSDNLNVKSVGELSAVTVTKDQYVNGYQHPQTVNATLSNGETMELTVNQDSWTSNANIDVNEMGIYTWTADLVLPENVKNPLGLKVSYVMDYRSDFLDSDMNSIAALAPVNLTKQEWENGYQHPAEVTATLVDGSTITVTINQETWSSEPAFDVTKKAAYIWTAELVAVDGNRNHRNLKATYQMNYAGEYVSDHDYENDFTFEIWKSEPWGKGMDSNSGSGGFELTQKIEDSGNAYMFASVNGGGDRGSRLDLTTQIIKGSEITFDWMPVTCDSTANGQVMFVSPNEWHPYFVLRFDKDYNISAYTENPLGACSTTQKPFEGSIGAANPIVTGLGGQNKWFTVSLRFDYLKHQADFTITEKDNPSNSFAKTGIPIEAEANGIRSMVVHMNKISGKPTVAMGLDNIIVDYVTFGPTEVVSVKKIANVKVAKSQFESFEFPVEATVGLGDGTSIQVPVGQWTATPDFDLATSQEGDYVWTAPLVLDGLTNVYGLSPSFTMTYTLLPFPTYLYNPNTLELSFGEALPTDFPTEVYALMSNGGIDKVKVGQWNPVRAFNAEEEGIYVYGANVAAEDCVYNIIRDQITPNENPADPSAQRADYVYDVYYRVSYFKSNDSYNAYQRSMEYLDRGVYAIESDNGVFVSWRLLVTEYGEDISFDVYRNGQKVNTEAITDRTNFMDASGKAGDVYTVAKIQGGMMYESEEVKATAENYKSIPVQKPAPQPTKDGALAGYTLNDAGAADVDGDGEYEIIVKWYPDNAFDSGAAVAPSSPTIFDVYKMDGTPLWRLNLGLELPSGAHFNQFMFYDLNEDGKAELFIKTSDGSVTYRPNANGLFDMNDESTIVSYIGDRNVVPGTNVNGNGHVNSRSNEYVTVFNGLTGEEIDTIPYVNTTGEFTDWGTTSSGGNDGGNRSARYNIALAYLPKAEGSTETIPAVLLNRGYYAKTTIAAYTLRDGKLQLEWNFYTESGTETASKGNHNVSTGDIDKDGFDEIVIGAMAVDHDGTVLWVKNGKDGQDFAGHADAIHLAAMNPDNNDLYVFVPAEEQNATVNHSLTNAATGARLNGSYFTRKDVGRAMAANITPRPGYEYWSAATNSGIYGFDGSVISTTKPVSMNWALYWDGDLLSELGDGIATDDDWAITKYDWVNNQMDTIAVLEGTKTNNSTKKTPSLTADLFGDWREEVVMRNEDDTELRIYMTTEETEYMIYTLMHDPVYRNTVANQNTAYNQPPHIGFYLGADNEDTVLSMGLPTANVRYTVDLQEEGKPLSTP